jgi:hypothetical protein
MKSSHRIAGIVSSSLVPRAAWMSARETSPGGLSKHRLHVSLRVPRLRRALRDSSRGTRQSPFMLARTLSYEEENQ